jgi:hypothetical protein
MLKADLHIHSNHSDGIDSVKKLLQAAIEKRLDAISITDHDTINGSLEAIEIAEEESLPIVVIPGVEISTENGHLLAYGIYEDIEADKNMQETAFEVRRMGGVSAIAHPFQFHKHGIVKIAKAIHAVDAIEVFNAKFYIGLCNTLAVRVSRKYKKAVIAGSDAHGSEAIGFGVTLLNVASKDIGSMIQSIRDGQTSFDGKRIPIALQLKTYATRLRWVSWK